MKGKTLDNIMLWVFVGVVILSIFVSIKLVGQLIINLG